MYTTWAGKYPCTDIAYLSYTGGLSVTVVFSFEGRRLCSLQNPHCSRHQRCLRYLVTWMLVCRAGRRRRSRCVASPSRYQ